MTRWSRRSLLAGGVALGLPALELLRPRPVRGALDSEPRRFIGYFVPNGVARATWTPPPGPALTLSPSLAALAPVQDRVVVLSGLANGPAVPEVAGSHATGTAAFLSAAHPRRSETDVHAGTSLDQRLAAAVGHLTPLPSLQLGCEGGGSIGACDIGYSCAYYRSISWAGPTRPLPKLTSPRLVFDLLVAGDDLSQSAAERAQRRATRRSVLDSVLADAGDLRRELGAVDRARLDEYLDGLRALERQLEAPAAIGACDPGERPDAPHDFPEHVAMMTELMVIALRCDRTRAITFMLGNAASNRDYSFIGAAGGHHDLSHHAGDPAKKSALELIDAWQVTQFAHLLMRLAETPAGDDGSLLDATAVLFGSDVGDGNSHTHVDLPVLLAGLPAAWGGGRHLSYETGTPIARLFVSVLQALGQDDQTFGDDGDGPLAGLATGA